MGRSGTPDYPSSLHLGYQIQILRQLLKSTQTMALGAWRPLWAWSHFTVKQGSCRRQRPMGSPNSRSEAANRSLLLLVSLCARLLRHGEGQGCRPIPSPSPPFMQIKRQPWWHDFVLSRGPGSPSPSFPSTVCARMADSTKGRAFLGYCSFGEAAANGGGERGQVRIT